MSQENLQRVHEQYARYNAGERVPDPDHAAQRGIDAIATLFASWLEAYADLKLEIQEAEAQGDKVFLWSDGKAASVVEYSDRNQALEAVGLSG